MRFLKLAVLVFVLGSSFAHADSAWIRKVLGSEIIVDSSAYGQCMVRFSADVDVQSYLPLCRPGHITFDCGAELPGSTRINSLEKFDVAKTAIALGRKISLLITDDQTIDGFCLARQIRMHKQ